MIHIASTPYYTDLSSVMCIISHMAYIVITPYHTNLSLWGVFILLQDSYLYHTILHWFVVRITSLYGS